MIKKNLTLEAHDAWMEVGKSGMGYKFEESPIPIGLSKIIPKLPEELEKPKKTFRSIDDEWEASW